MNRNRGSEWLVAGLLALLLAGPAHASPLISEVAYDALGSDDGGVFVELAGVPGAPVDGLALEGVNGSDGSVTVTVSLSGSFPADGLFVVADSAAGGGTRVAGADQLADFDFQNGPDSVLLLSGSTILDAVGYGSFGPGDVFAGEGSPAPDAPAGESIARRFADVDTGDNAADFVVLATPTPGSAPWQSLPEPGAPALLGAAGLWAAGRRRRR